MTKIDYKSLYDQVGARNGWDFSKVKCLSEGVAWDYGSEVTRACTGTEALLDIGTGGGEQLLKIAGFVRQAVGIDNSAAMIETARSNGRKANQPDVAFLEMDAEALDFPDRSFQIVICRQAPFEAKEVARVLADDGVFITQQVGGRDKINLIEAFGRGQSSGASINCLQDQYITELNEAGFTDIRSSRYDATEYYRSAEDLIFLLKHAPIIPDFGQAEGDFEVLRQFIEDNRTEQGIRTNAHRFLIVARK